MSALLFVLGFALVHAVAYTVAGAIALSFSRDLYAEKERVLDFMRDMNDDAESTHVKRWFLPVQLVRGVLLAVVLLPILGLLGEATFLARFAFLFGAAVLWMDVASSVPFPNTLEGAVYLKPRYLRLSRRGKLYAETLLYGLLFAAPVAWLLF